MTTPFIKSEPASFTIGEDSKFLDRFAPAFVLFSFLILRLTLLYKSPDILFNTDELYQGFIGFEWLHGLKTWLQNYQTDHYTAGSIVTGSLAALPFKFFGANLLALKLVPLFFSAGALWWLMSLLKEQFNLKTSLAAGILFTLAPPGFSALSVQALGSHPESIFFLGATVFGFFRATAKALPVERDLFVFALLGGIACWFDQINTAGVLLCFFLTLWQFRRHQLIRILAILSAGFFCGFLPWAIYNFYHQWLGARFLATQSIPPLDFLRNSFLNFFNLCAHFFPQALFFRSHFGIMGKFFALAYTLLLLSGYISLIIFFLLNRKTASDPRWKQKCLFFLLFPPLFLTLFAYYLQNFNWHYEFSPYRFRYYIPFFYFSVVPAAILVGYSNWFKILFAALVIFGVLGQYDLFSYPSSAQAWKMPGYYLESPERLWRQACVRIPQNPQEIERKLPELLYCDSFWELEMTNNERIDLAARLSPENKHFFYIAWGRHHTSLIEDPWKDALSIPIEIPEAYRNIFFHGLSKGLNWQAPPSLQILLISMQRLPEELQPFYLMALGEQLLTWTSVSGPPKLSFLEYGEYLSKSNGTPRTWLIRGIGRALLWTIESPTHLDYLIQRIPMITTHDDHDILWGIGWELRERGGPVELIQKFEPAKAKSLLEGYHANAHWIEKTQTNDFVGGSNAA